MVLVEVLPSLSVLVDVVVQVFLLTTMASTSSPSSGEKVRNSEEVLGVVIVVLTVAVAYAVAVAVAVAVDPAHATFIFVQSSQCGHDPNHDHEKVDNPGIGKAEDQREHERKLRMVRVILRIVG